MPQLFDVVREQVDVMSLGNHVDYDICPGGAVVLQARDPSPHVNCFYPLTGDFRYPPEVLRKLAGFYGSRGVDGCVFDPFRMYPERAFATIAFIHVPATCPVGHIDSDFSCERIFDLELWSRTYGVASPATCPDSLHDRMAAIMRFRETRLYLFKHRKEIVGAGSLVRTTGDTYLASGFSIRKGFRNGSIMSRARAVRMATDSDVIAMTTDIRFARALVRALGNARVLGSGDFVPISSLAADFAGEQSAAATASA